MDVGRKMPDSRRGSLPLSTALSPQQTKKRVAFQRVVSTEHLVVGVQKDGHKNKLVRSNTVFTFDMKERAKLKPSSGKVPNSPSEKVPNSPSRVAASTVEDLLECPVCSERLAQPKMLPCQHTFCGSCLHDRLLTSKGRAYSVLRCPTCLLSVQLPARGPDGTDVGSGILALPTNLYIDSLLKMLDQQSDSLPTPETAGMRCVRCQTACVQDNFCQHCRQILCEICWSGHVMELKTEIGSLHGEIEGAVDKLRHRTENYKDRCEKLTEHINEAVEIKLQALRQEQDKLLNDVQTLVCTGNLSSQELLGRLQTTKNTISEQGGFDNATGNAQKVSIFLKLHRATSDLLREVSHWGEARPVFDQDSLSIQLAGETDDAEQPENELSSPTDPQRQADLKGASPDSLSLYYRSRSFYPRLALGRSTLQRPVGVGVAPWDSAELYVAGSDSHQLLVIDRIRGKLIRRLTAPEMLCPQGIAFSESRLEVYVTDKWNHCIHVFDQNDRYLRSLGHKGQGEGQFRSPEGIAAVPACDSGTEEFLYVCDTGNDRVQVVRASDGAVERTLGLAERQVKGRSFMRTEMNQPTGVAIGGGRVVVADCGNKRIKVYSMEDEKLLEFGSHGGSRGQFRCPECVAVDQHGFILVGDSGNARVQIFRPNGNLVRMFGGRGKLRWVSGIHVTPTMDIAVTDFKNHSILIF